MFNQGDTQGYIRSPNINLGHYPQRGYSPQEDYVPQGGYAQGRHLPQGGYQPQGGYLPQGGYALQGEYLPPKSYLPRDGDLPLGGYAPQGSCAPQGGCAPEGVYLPQGGYPTQVEVYPAQSGFSGQQTGYGFNVDTEGIRRYYGELNPPYEHHGGVIGPGMPFSEKSIRRVFVRKLYCVLMGQLLVTVGFIALFLFHKGVAEWTRRNPAFYLAVLLLSFVLIFVLACCVPDSIRRKPPLNFIFLGLFTIVQGIVLGAYSATYGKNEVPLAVGVTTLVCLALIIFSFQTMIEFTAWVGIIVVGVTILCITLSMVIVLRGTFPIVNTIYASCIAFLFSVYLVYDTESMMEGRRNYSISAEEYVFVTLTLNLYLDIVNICSCRRGGMGTVIRTAAV